MVLKRENISNTLNSLAKTFDKKHYEESWEFIQNITNIMDKRTLTNPERFYNLIKYGMDIKLRSLLQFINQRYFSEENMCNKSLNKLIFLFSNYGYLANHIENLFIAKLETSSCSCDISRYLLTDVYLSYLKTNIIKDTKIEEEKFYKPSFGTNEQWIEYIDSLIYLYYIVKTKESQEIRAFIQRLKPWVFPPVLIN